jgi:hypothetical protein
VGALWNDTATLWDDLVAFWDAVEALELPACATLVITEPYVCTLTVMEC